MTATCSATPSSSTSPAGCNSGGSAVSKPGYNFGIQFIKPDFLRRDQSLQIDLDAIKQSLEAYDQRALLQKIEIDRKLSDTGPSASG